MTKTFLRWIVLFLILLHGGSDTLCQDRASASSTPIALVMRSGTSEDGTITPEWKEAIRHWHEEEALAAIVANPKRRSEYEIRWARHIAERVGDWQGMIESLRIPFVGVEPPEIVTVLLGNQGGNDAFVFSPSTICFDLSRLYEEYGDTTETVNGPRIDRFFAHEFTHVMHKAWAKKNNLQLRTPLGTALWECLTEGLGNYRSLSEKWVNGRGELTPHAREVLAGLEPIFVERLCALPHASEKDLPNLMQGLSIGPFDRKWGAVTVALWLAQEAAGDDRNLRKWVEAGPTGVFALADKYLPEGLREKMPKPGGL